MNIKFVKDEVKNKIFKQKLKLEEENQIGKENMKMVKRLEETKSFINTKKLDDYYNNQHQKDVEKLKKIHPGDIIRSVPRISVLQSLQNSNKDRSVTLNNTKSKCTTQSYAEQNNSSSNDKNDYSKTVPDADNQQKDVSNKKVEDNKLNDNKSAGGDKQNDVKKSDDNKDSNNNNLNKSNNIGDELQRLHLMLLD